MHSTHVNTRSQEWLLTLGALGVVFGDIGTSPLYAMRECLHHAKDGVDLQLAVFGSLSLILYSLLTVVTIKYVVFILRADNNGEGGVFALLALLRNQVFGKKGAPGLVAILLLAGAALLYGDGVITPAISILGAVEGLQSIAPSLSNWIPGISAVILVMLFSIQKRGTGQIGAFFGPVILLWFTTIGGLGLWHMLHNPIVLQAINPYWGFQFLWRESGKSAAILGSVVLVVTGAEALYADLGHFGRKAISRAWLFAAFPGLILSYFGQGAYVLRHGSAEGGNPFFEMAPAGPLRYFLLGLSVLASIIASQALISGVFSLSRQAIQLGFFPRLHVVHTSAEQEGQIYMPFLNWSLAAASIAVVLGFKSSGALASAYGIAVTATMVITSLGFYMVCRKIWGWSFNRTAPLCAAFMVIDLAFFGTNLTKIVDGGWLPLGIAAIILITMTTWYAGRLAVAALVSFRGIDIEMLVKDLEVSKVVRVRGEAIFMAASSNGVPVVLLHHMKMNQCLHQTVTLMTVITEPQPRVPLKDRYALEEKGGGVSRLIVHLGYMEAADVPALLAAAPRPKDAPKFSPNATTYYFNRESIFLTGKSKLALWQKALYRVLSQNARPARDNFDIPPNRIVEIGLPVEL